MGYIHYMKVEPSVVHLGMAKGVSAIQAEFGRYAGDAANEVKECMHYVLHQAAGSSPKLFENSPHPRDHSRNGERLGDFCRLPESQTSRLEMANVLALRLYTTAAYKVLNGPFRDTQHTQPHEFPVTIAFLREAIGKLRAVGAQEDAARERAHTKLDLWRGLRDTDVPESFLQRGGTELSPMSTTRSLEVALQYTGATDGKHCLLFKLHTESFMQRGASISFLSAFPAEEEVLYPPLTFLKPTTKQLTVPFKGKLFKVIEVVPQFGG